MESGGLAESTSRRYRQAFDRFEKWYGLYGLGIMEGEGMECGDEALWLLWLAYEDKISTYKAIKSRIFGLKYEFKMRFGFDPFKTDREGKARSFLRFEQVLKQVKRNHHQRPKIKFSVTKFVLSKCKEYVDFESWEDVLCWAVVTVGVDRLLRWSEITDSGRGMQGRSKLLKRSNLCLGETAMWLDLNDTKTKLFVDPMTVAFHKEATRVCPFEGMNQWLKIRPQKSQWIFCKKDGSPVKTRWVQDRVKCWSVKAGYRPCQMEGGVSLRKGGALGMALCGVPDRVIRAYGIWKSFAYRTYIDLTEREKGCWRRVMVEKLNEGNEEMWGSWERESEQAILQRLQASW